MPHESHRITPRVNLTKTACARAEIDIRYAEDVEELQFTQYDRVSSFFGMKQPCRFSLLDNAKALMRNLRWRVGLQRTEQRPCSVRPRMTDMSS